MISSIRTQTVQEHNALIKQIDKLVVALNRLPNDIKWGDATWAPDMEMLNFIKVQILSLQNAKRTALLGYYRDSFHIIRMAFEGYFTCRLITTCSLYPVRIKIARKKEDANLIAAKNRIIADPHSISKCNR